MSERERKREIESTDTHSDVADTHRVADVARFMMPMEQGYAGLAWYPSLVRFYPSMKGRSIA